MAAKQDTYLDRVKSALTPERREELERVVRALGINGENDPMFPLLLVLEFYQTRFEDHPGKIKAAIDDAISKSIAETNRRVEQAIDKELSLVVAAASAELSQHLIDEQKTFFANISGWMNEGLGRVRDEAAAQIRAVAGQHQAANAAERTKWLAYSFGGAFALVVLGAYFCKWALTGRLF